MKFKLYGIDIRISYLTVALLALAVLIARGEESLLPVCLACSFIHEFGHLVAICRFGKKPSSITIKPFDVDIVCDMTEITRIQDFIINAAGILFNLISAVIFLVLNYVFRYDFIFDFYACSLIIGVFNLLPLKGLDGGQMLYLMLSTRFSVNITDRILNILTLVLILPIATAGFLVLLISKYNYSLLFVAIYMTIFIISKEMR